MPYLQKLFVLKRPGRSWLMVGVYFLHLLFFRSVMVETKASSSFRLAPIASQCHHQKKHPRTLPGDYALLLKHENAEPNNLQVAERHDEGHTFYHPSIIGFAGTCSLADNTRAFCLPDDAFKLYKLQSVFLI